MTLVYCCSTDHYGEGAASGEAAGGAFTWDLDALTNFSGDAWAGNPITSSASFFSGQGTIGFEAPPWGTRQGDYALTADSFRVDSNGSYTVTGTESMRLAIPGASQTVRLVHFAFGLDALPVQDKIHGQICHLMTSAGDIQATLAVDPSGRLQLLDGGEVKSPTGPITSAQTKLLVSSAPVISPDTWYFFSIKIDGTAFDLYIGDIVPANLILSGSALGFSAAGNTDILGFLPATLCSTLSGSAPAERTIRAVRDIVVCDEAGSYNNILLGQCFVSAQEMRAEDDGGGWSVHPRENLGTGILDHDTTQTGLRLADAASLELGSGDFTFETFIRFDTLPSSPDQMAILTKWRDASGLRSYELYYDGADGTLVWNCSTDGSAVTEVKRVPWVPTTDFWHHIAVVRSTAELLFFVDGTQIGVPVADTNTYHNATSYVGIGVWFDSSGDPDTTGRFDGWLDETRFTVGTARYTSDFTKPTSQFGRSAGEDADFSDVVFLAGYDGTIEDESSYNRTVTVATSSPVTAQIPDDGTNKYDVLNNRPAWDDTHIEAAFLTAEGIFTFEAVPTASETMTVGSKTYTWVTALSSAGPNEILIGATIPDCIDNAIAAINAGTGEGVVYGAGTTANTDAYATEFLSPQFSVIALSAGAAGNSIATTETMADGFFSASTLEGGQDIPDASDFAIERLPRDATGVLGVQVTARTYKTDAGSSSIRFDLIGPSDGVNTGDAQTPDLSPAWARQVFEEDPDTSASLTPSTVTAGRIRIGRLT